MILSCNRRSRLNIMELSICTTDKSRTVELTLWVVCACVNFVIRRSSRFYNTQRTSWQPLWWRRNVWCFTVAEAVRRANRKLPIIIFHTVPELPCYDTLGMENYNISDAQISASSSHDGYSPQDARLHFGSAWVAYQPDIQWIQVRFLRQVPITGVITQGEEGENIWVKTYKVRYSLDYENWRFVLDENGEDEVNCVDRKNAFFCYNITKWSTTLDYDIHNRWGVTLY